MSSESILEMYNVSRNFGGVAAVSEVSFSVLKSEVFGLIGPNGAGKTTLFNLITGLTPLSSGSILFSGKECSGVKPHRIARMGMARTFQNIRLFREMTVLENILAARHIVTKAGLIASLLGTPTAAKEEKHSIDKAYSLLEKIGLNGKGNVKASSLSYGEQRKLEIGRALATEPDLLLLDEPAAGMNPSEKHSLSSFILQIHDQLDITILLIEHHVPMVMGVCSRVAVLDFGKLIALGSPEEVQNDPAVIEAYLGGD